MGSLLCITGPCGCGKSTLAGVYAEMRMHSGAGQVYVIHGDSFHRGFAGEGLPGALPWPQVLRFNWDCILSVAEMALARGMEVVVDYVVEEELPELIALAHRCGVEMRYVVLTASRETIASRLSARGDAQLTERALFLKGKLDSMAENEGRLLDNTGLSVRECAQRLTDPRFLLVMPG